MPIPGPAKSSPPGPRILIFCTTMDIPRPPKWKRVLKRTLLSLAILLAVALASGFIIQQRRDADFRTTHPPSGSFVSVEGRRIHFRQSGDGEFTFILEAGLGDYSGSWGTLESSLAGIGRVFVYDRAGLGWSDASPHPRTARQIARELHEALEAAHVRKPYILVGHSLGGISQTLYAMEYPGDVAGLLLIDPSHKDQFVKLPPPPASPVWVMTQVSRAARFGLPQLLFQSSDPVQNQTSHMLATGAELRAALNATENWGDRAIRLGTIPITVLTAGDDTAMPGQSAAERKASWEIWKNLHDELIASSSSEIRRHIVVEGASHYIQRTHPAAVVDAARELVNRIKTQTPCTH